MKKRNILLIVYKIWGCVIYTHKADPRSHKQIGLKHNPRNHK